MEIKWRAPEYPHYAKSVSWYWITIIAAIIIAAISLWRGNILFVFFIVVAEVLILFWAKREPNMIEFRITKDAIHIGDLKTYAYDELKGFAVKNDELILERKHRLSPHIKIPLPAEKGGRIREVLSRFVAEIEHEESLVDHIGRFLGF